MAADEGLYRVERTRDGRLWIVGAIPADTPAGPVPFFMPLKDAERVAAALSAFDDGDWEVKAYEPA